ncbi:unnamed protein product [Gongylonema pulchrum]|uniref:MgtE domain-containing protein n=1 Tax=Gongylonema pulchrum TaxID=637853 RepID=A0A183D4J6_9BILA|nr:unnamed protein product [Gongylonema pulchrum]
MGMLLSLSQAFRIQRHQPRHRLFYSFRSVIYFDASSIAFVLRNILLAAQNKHNRQVLFPFLTAGIGMVFAGLVLDTVQHWNLFVQVPETFILVPALLGLKGNLEMTFASRLSTLANMGRMDSSGSRWTIIIANLALIQVQAIIVAFLASSFAVMLAWIPKGQVLLFSRHEGILCALKVADLRRIKHTIYDRNYV